MPVLYTISRNDTVNDHPTEDIVVSEDGTMVTKGIAYFLQGQSKDRIPKGVYLTHKNPKLAASGYFTFFEEDLPPRIENGKVYYAYVTKQHTLRDVTNEEGHFVMILIRDAESFTCSHETVLMNKVEIRVGRYDFLVLVQRRQHSDIDVDFGDDLIGEYSF